VDLLTRHGDKINIPGGLKSLEILILDEADRLLHMGFQASLDTILGFLPKQRRTGLFSATQTHEVENLARAGLRNPVTVSVKERKIGQEDSVTPVNLDNYYVVCEADKKLAALITVMKKKKGVKFMVFMSTCAAVEYFSLVLKELLNPTKVLCIHGKMKQNRFKIFDQFRQLESGVLVCTDVMARGIDIADIDWVLQFDAPSNADAFVHRCGRTARIGNQGTAVVFLMPHEDVYANFIDIHKKVKLKELDMDMDNLPDFLPRIRKMQLNDRAIMDKATRAYVSFVRSYSKHECNVLLRVKDLDFGTLATGFGLLKLPKMPELKRFKASSFQPYDVDLNTVAYKDKVREKIRLEKLATYRETGVWPVAKADLAPHKKKEAWSENKEQKFKKKEKKQLKLETKNKKKKRKIDQDEWDELARDTHLMKKLKKKKIKDTDFDKEFENDATPDA